MAGSHLLIALLVRSSLALPHFCSNVDLLGRLISLEETGVDMLVVLGLRSCTFPSTGR
jgi:hypothetical protein